MRIGESFIVAPDARLIPAGERRHPIIVPQEQAFGTGSHETTSLCIEMLEGLDIRGRRGLDIGTGSGILAIAMLRLGAAKVIAFDNDVDAYGPLRDNQIRYSDESDLLDLAEHRDHSLETLRTAETPRPTVARAARERHAVRGSPRRRAPGWC